MFLTEVWFHEVLGENLSADSPREKKSNDEHLEGVKHCWEYSQLEILADNEASHY